jgi:hypothetical protein
MGIPAAAASSSRQFGRRSRRTFERRRVRSASRVLASLVALGTLLAACGSGDNALAPDAQAGNPSPSARQDALPTPSIEGETPDERFETWLETGGPEEVYEAWLGGQLPGGPPPPDATDEQLRTLFERWVQDHMRLIRGAWNRAQDKGAQSDLRNGIVVALVFAVDGGSFEGLTPREARSIDPSLTYNESTTVFGEISIRQASATAVLLTTESATGTFFCAARLMDGSDTSLGMVDATTVSDCAGGWPE